MSRITLQPDAGHEVSETSMYSLCLLAAHSLSGTAAPHLAVVNMAHDGNNGRPRQQMVQVLHIITFDT